MWRLVVLFAFLASAAPAEMIKAAVKVKVLAVGGQCDAPPDAIVAAPNAGGGQYENTKGLADYVVKGDRFPAQRAMGIGLRVKLSGKWRGKTVTVLVLPPVGRTGSWEQTVASDGTIDFGRLPAIGEALPEGRYLLSVLDQGIYLFTYAITLDGVAEESLCVPVS